MQRPTSTDSNAIDIRHKHKHKDEVISRLRCGVAHLIYYYDSGRPTWHYGRKWKDIVTLKGVEIAEYLWGDVIFPVCTYEGKTFPPMDSVLIATENGHVFEPAVHQLVYDLSCKLESFILNVIVKNDIQSLDAVRLLITTFILPTGKYLDVCYKHNQPEVAEALLNNSLKEYSFDEIIISVRNGTYHHSANILLVFYRYVKSKNNPRNTSNLMFEIGRKENGNEATLAIIQDDPSLLKACAISAVDRDNIELLKIIAPETDKALINKLFSLGIKPVNCDDLEKPTAKLMNRIVTADYLLRHATERNGDNTPLFFLGSLGTIYKNALIMKLDAVVLTGILKMMHTLNECQAYRPKDIWEISYLYTEFMQTAQYGAARDLKEANKNNLVLVILFEKENQEACIRQLNTSLTNPIVSEYFTIKSSDLWEPNKKTKNLLLHTAVSMRETAVVSFILSTHDFRLPRDIIHSKNKEGKSALRLAIESNQLEIVNMFIAHVTTNIAQKEGEPSLLTEEMYDLARETGHHEIASALRTAISTGKRAQTTWASNHSTLFYANRFSSQESRSASYSPM